MYTINEITTIKENQIFDRKSIRVNPKALAIPLVAFANADGGSIAVGIKDNEKKINEILRVGYDFCIPTLKVDFKRIKCIDSKGNRNQILLLNIQRSQRVHTNQLDEVYYRVGDRSKKLTFEERMQLMYDKGDRFYEDTPILDATITDIDFDKVQSYLDQIKYIKRPLEFLTTGKQFIRKIAAKYEVSVGAILLFGKYPQKFFPRANIRFIKYQGIDEKTGQDMNVIKDVTFEGTILEILQASLYFVETQIKEFTRLKEDGKFNTDAEYPEFVWKELIVNAVCHRDYSIKGTDIQIKMFTDRLVVESPGRLPSFVKLDNIRSIHFSRNPKIAEFLKNYTYVKEFGEGIDRIYILMDSVGLPEPKYEQIAFMTKVTVRNSGEHVNEYLNLSEREKSILKLMSKNQRISQEKISIILSISKSTIRRDIQLVNYHHL